MSTIQNLNTKTFFISYGDKDAEFPEEAMHLKPGQFMQLPDKELRIVIQEPHKEEEMTQEQISLYKTSAIQTEIVRQLELTKKRVERLEVEAHDATKAIANHVKVGDFCPHTRV